MTLANSCNCCGKVEFGQGCCLNWETYYCTNEADHKQNLQQYQFELFNGSIRSVMTSTILWNFSAVLNLSEKLPLLPSKQVTQGYEEKLQQYHSLELFNGSIRSVMTNTSFVKLAASSQSQWDNYHYHREQVTQGYEEKLQQYQEAFTRAIQRRYPLSNDEREFVRLAAVLNLSETITDEIEAAETYNLKPRLPTAAPREGG